MDNIVGEMVARVRRQPFATGESTAHLSPKIPPSYEMIAMNPRPSSDAHPAVRLLAEFVIIVLGIVSALAVDGWSQGRAAAEEEFEYLTAIRGDMELNLQIALDMAETHDRIASAAELVLRVVDGGEAASPTYPELAVAVETTGLNLWDPFVWDTWDDLISTGNSDLISNPDVRTSIQSLYGFVERMEILEAEWFDYQQRFRDRADEIVSPWDRIAIAEAGLQDQAFQGEGDVDALRNRLMNTEGLSGPLADVVLTHHTGGRWYRDIAADIEALLALLGEEL